ncbi:MAG: twin-arginine translocation signal domain-containing protein [Candidatus Omnitrophica bacterium]|nr:twin-arginine translocation signal domain-containing protein [Candidatus Omnitrophota bacterium]
MSEQKSVSRRNFLRVAAAGTAALGCSEEQPILCRNRRRQWPYPHGCDRMRRPGSQPDGHFHRE